MKQTSLIAYADCFAGVSGDMFLGALLHAGLPEVVLRTTLSQLDIGGYTLSVSKSKKNGIGCIKLDIDDQSAPQLRHLSSIRQLLETSDLDESIIQRSIRVFEEIARAEAKVHDIDAEHVHFHEVGAVDTIIDVVGVIAGLHHFGIGNLFCAPVPTPRGFVKCAHGTLPLPAPAVCEILADVPCYGVDITKELVTPTGAALIKVLSSGFGPMPPMIISHTGYGAGSHILAGDMPNLFRLIIGQERNSTEHQLVEVIETNLDDWIGEGFPHLCERLFSQGALDVSLASIQMKKGRPGYCLTVISPLHLALELKNIIFTETTSIGVRQRKEYRHTLPREIIEVETIWGTIKAKKITTPAGDRIYPEYEECRRLAQEHNLPLQQVYTAVQREKNLP